MAKMPLDLSTLNDEQFEDLVEAIFRARIPQFGKETSASFAAIQLSVVSVDRSGRGTDEGRDLLVTTLVSDCIPPRRI